MTHPIHDGFFQQSLQDPKVAEDFLSQQLPAALLPLIEWSTLRLENTEFITEKFKRMRNDCLLSLQLKNQEDTVYTYVNVEHWSSENPKIPLKMMRYIPLN